MRVGIDWVSVALVGAAFALSRARTLSLRVRYGGMALLFAVLTAAHLRFGAEGLNGLLTGFAALLTLYYAFRAIRS